MLQHQDVTSDYGTDSGNSKTLGMGYTKISKDLAFSSTSSFNSGEYYESDEMVIIMQSMHFINIVCRVVLSFNIRVRATLVKFLCIDMPVLSYLLIQKQNFTNYKDEFYYSDL